MYSLTPYASTIDNDTTQQRQSSVASHGSHRVSCPQYPVRSAEDMATGNLCSLFWNPQLTKHVQSPFGENTTFSSPLKSKDQTA